MRLDGPSLMSRYEASGEKPDGARLLRFKDLIRANVPVARQALREILIGPVVLESCRGWLHDPAEALRWGIVPQRAILASPRELEGFARGLIIPFQT